MYKIQKVLLIVNPAAGKGRAGMLIQDFSVLFNKNEFETTVYLTKGPGDATEYVKNISDDYDIIVCRGGDGTFHEVINGVMRLEKKRPLGYIPSGTTNDLAKSLGIPAKTRPAVDIIRRGRPTPFDLGLFNGETYFSYVASFGAFTKASYATTQRSKNMHGRFAYLAEAAREVKEIRPVHMRVVSGDTTFEDDFIFGAVTNSVSAAKVIKYKRECVNLSDGVFEVLLVKNPGTADGWRKAVQSVINRDFNNEVMMFFHGSEVEFFSDDEVAWTVDGEYGGSSRESRIEVVPGGIEIYRSKNAIC